MAVKNTMNKARNLIVFSFSIVWVRCRFVFVSVDTIAAV
jgi:hypothetical protein